jgi:excisionase family DNA binding protein
VNRPTVHPNARLLTIAQAATEFGITSGTLRRLIANGELPSVRIPGIRRVNIDRRDLERLIGAWKECAS